MTTPPQASGAAADGRVRRGERSREAIVRALFELVGEGILEPTAQQVALRAGVVIRTVFRHFSERERLYAEMDAHVQAAAVPLLRGGRREGSLEARARALVRQRAAFCERIRPYKRSGEMRRWRSAFLQRQHGRLVRELRADLELWLPEIGGARAEVADALDLATSFEAWERLRGEQRLSVRRAQAATEAIVIALLRELPG